VEPSRVGGVIGAETTMFVGVAAHATTVHSMELGTMPVALGPDHVMIASKTFSPGSSPTFVNVNGQDFHPFRWIIWPSQ